MKVENLEPIEDRVMVLRDEAKKVTDGGIEIPETSVEEEVFGTVVAVGPGEWNPTTGQYKPMQCKVGDRVALSTYAGSTLPIDDVEYTILRECDLLCRIVKH